VAQGISWPALNQAVCALRFFYGVTLGLETIPERIDYAREPRKLVLNVDEVVRFLEAACRTFVLLFDIGEEAVTALKAFSVENDIEAAQLSAIGALERGVVAWLNWETKAYEPVSVNEQCEVISILGDIAKDDDSQPSVHLHGLLGLKGGRTVGGHV
jgi:predicted DNA-binding protein with PD1-like motif